MSPSQGEKNVTLIHGCDSLAVAGASIGCESAWDGPRGSLLLLLPKSWLSGGCFSSLMQAGQEEEVVREERVGFRAAEVCGAIPICDQAISSFSAPQCPGRK